MSQTARFVDYDCRSPSPLFSREQIAYIESISAFLNDDELRRARAFEAFRVNVDDKTAVCFEIPGLRSSRQGVVIYIKRFSQEKYLDLAHRILDLVLPEPFGKEVRRFVMRPCRITLPNGDRYYPFSFGAHAAMWRQRMSECAVALGTASGQFDRDRFVLSNGQSFAFGALTIETAPKSIPDNW